MTEVLSGEMQPAQITYADFDSFYASCWDDMYRTLSVALRDPDLAREAVDEAMTRALQQWSSVRTYSNQSGWVYRVAFNWAISQKRKTGRLTPAIGCGSTRSWAVDARHSSRMAWLRDLGS